MTGLIWPIQVLHYPSFRYVEDNKFKEFELFHTRSISYIVMPIMLLELFSGLYLVYLMKTNLYMVNVIFNVTIFITTFFLSVPRHQKLQSIGKDAKTINSLILTNWPRTFLWSFRSVLLLYLLLNMI